MLMRTIFRQFSQQSRGLTEGEVALARLFFGDDIPYQDVRLHENTRLMMKEASAMVPDNNMFFRDSEYERDFYQCDSCGRSFFIHEMAHVWQFYNGQHPVNGFVAILLEAKTSGKSYFDFYDPWEVLKYRQAEGQAFDPEDFDQMNIEQQAQFIQVVFYHYDQWVENGCPENGELFDNCLFHFELIQAIFPRGDLFSDPNPQPAVQGELEHAV